MLIDHKIYLKHAKAFSECLMNKQRKPVFHPNSMLSRL